MPIAWKSCHVGVHTKVVEEDAELAVRLTALAFQVDREFMPSDVDTKLQKIVHESLTRVCVDAQLDRLRLVPRPFDGAAHAKLYASLTGTYAAHVAAIQGTFLSFACSANAVAPINQLPPDVLVEILANLPRSARFATSHVCSYWRSTALDAATLWSTISLDVRFGKKQQLVEYLRRTKDAPTSVAIRVRGTMGRAAKLKFTSILPHMHHLKALDIFLDRDDKEDEVTFDGLRLEIPPSPPLKSLIVRSYDWTDRIHIKLSGAPGAFASLQRLHLGATPRSLFTRWPDLPSLTDLRFQLDNMYGGMTIDFKVLEEALRKCPLLSQLVISDVPYDSLNDPNRSIDLPNLRRLGLAGYVDGTDPMRVLLKFLSSPNIPHVSMYGYAPDEGFSQALHFVIEEDTPNVVDAYITRYSTLPEIQYHVAFTGRNEEMPFSLCTVDDREFTRTLYCLPTPRDVISTYSTTLRRLFVDVYSWSHLLATMNVAFLALEELVIFGCPFYLTVLRQIVAPLRVPSLKRLTIYIVSNLRWGLVPEEWIARDIHNFLDQHITDYASPLETLKLYGGELEVASDAGGQLEQAELNDSSLADVRSSLHERANVLDIRNDQLSEAEFTALRSWIPDPPWMRTPSGSTEH